MQTIGDQTFVNPRDTRLAYADIIGEESLSGKLISAGPILERIDIFGAAVAENVACKGIATISVDRVDFKSQIAHGDLVRLEGEVIYTGSSSLAVQITGYRHDIEAGKFIHTLSAIMTCVALDENMRPSPGLPKLLDPLDPEYVRKHEEIAAQRKELAARWREVQEEVDQLPHVSVDMLKKHDNGRSLEVPIPDTLIEVQSSFLPKHLNRNNTIFGGEVLTWMDKVALYCARNFTKNQNMVTVSMNRIFFKLPITMDDIVTMHARISSVRRHHLEVEVEVFVGRIGSNERRKSHTGYFTVANLDRSYRMKQISTGLKVDENDQESMRTLLKAQHRWTFDDQELKLLTLEPLSLSTPAKLPFTPEEDTIIQEGFEKMGNRWTQIAELLPGRTEDAVKLRWKALNPNQKVKAKPGRPKLMPGMTVNKQRSMAPPTPDDVAATLMNGPITMPELPTYGNGYPDPMPYHDNSVPITPMPMPPLHPPQMGMPHSEDSLPTTQVPMPTQYPEPIVEPLSDEVKAEDEMNDAAILKELLRSHSLLSFGSARGLTSFTDMSPEDLLASGELDEMFRATVSISKERGERGRLSSASSMMDSLTSSFKNPESLQKAVQNLDHEDKHLFQGLIDSWRAQKSTGGDANIQDDHIASLPVETNAYSQHSFETSSGRNLTHSLDFQETRSMPRRNSNGISYELSNISNDIDDLLDSDLMRPIRKGKMY
ncbi:CWF19 protein 2 [Phytophthora nicotianae]|uniref:CWF19 protein 2 n=1 Tax=Phytophthora nicotianae TaxID=4792 RepID=A0A0W8CVF9_PHYNI|nr:CWF19 protein 2 [Phytophthora nicotianae]